ncbi:hypothetical protein PCANC_20103 [Puccinia coronata f. sp. avenae]|uniref:Uncharacterized protein n=1 Tax=Puccinia coronata f. sp. avenae TaxID=200324 RepID=A0A2N5TZD4_9BASI|nr:hypothetical protein PCANC_20103 [Puccinia coronata f. sp. avenae]
MAHYVGYFHSPYKMLCRSDEKKCVTVSTSSLRFRFQLDFDYYSPDEKKCVTKIKKREIRQKRRGIQNCSTASMDRSNTAGQAVLLDPPCSAGDRTGRTVPPKLVPAGRKGLSDRLA